jgi:hypothetical protein
MGAGATGRGASPAKEDDGAAVEMDGPAEAVAAVSDSEMPEASRSRAGTSSGLGINHNGEVGTEIPPTIACGCGADQACTNRTGINTDAEPNPLG